MVAAGWLPSHLRSRRATGAEALQGCAAALNHHHRATGADALQGCAAAPIITPNPKPQTFHNPLVHLQLQRRPQGSRGGRAA